MKYPFPAGGALAILLTITGCTQTAVITPTPLSITNPLEPSLTAVPVSITVTTVTALPPTPLTAAAPNVTQVPTASEDMALDCELGSPRLPPPGAPTLIPDGGTAGAGVPPDYVDPYVMLCASAMVIRLGQSVGLRARAHDIGLPYFQVGVRDPNQADFFNILLFQPEPQLFAESSRFVRVAWYDKAGPNEIVLGLTGIMQGTIEVQVSATGEIHFGFPGPATWAGGSSDALRITIK